VPRRCGVKRRVGTGRRISGRAFVSLRDVAFAKQDNAYPHLPLRLRLHLSRDKG